MYSPHLGIFVVGNVGGLLGLLFLGGCELGNEVSKGLPLNHWPWQKLNIELA